MTTGAQLTPWRDYEAKHFRWRADGDGKVATITLDRPAKKNPLTFESYAELRELFRGLVHGYGPELAGCLGYVGHGLPDLAPERGGRLHNPPWLRSWP